MRILYFHQDDSVHDRRFLDALGRMPLDVIDLQLERRAKLAHVWKPPQNSIKINWMGISEKFSWYQKPLMIRELKRLYQEYHPDVIHAGPVDLCAYLVASAGLTPLVSMSWGYDMLLNVEKNVSSRRRACFALDRTAVLLDDCQAVSRAAESLGFPIKRIITFPWGVDLNKYHPRIARTLFGRLGNRGSIVLLSTRQMEMRYGGEVVVNAFIRAAKDVEQLRLVMMADGSQKEVYKRQLAIAGLSDRVTFTGAVPEEEMVSYFHSSDAYISASHVDGSSVSLLQAMACGIPPLVSDIPGNREWVQHEKNGWLFKDGNSEELASLMIAVAHTPRLRRSFGEAARRTILANANWQKNSMKLLDAYQMAINMHAGKEMPA